MLVSNSLHKDRVMNHCECSSINDVDRCFKTACNVVFKMKKLLESVESSGGQIKFQATKINSFLVELNPKGIRKFKCFIAIFRL